MTGKKKTKKCTSKQLSIEASKDDENKALAETVIKPTFLAACTIREYGKSFGKLDMSSLVESLSEQTDAAIKDDLERGEAMLVAQAHTLDAIFHVMARRAAINVGHYPDTVERYLKLALRAQSQSRATWDTLSTMKNPPMVGYVKQANIAHGHQQVNNTAMDEEGHSNRQEKQKLKNKQLEKKDGERLDNRATQTTVRDDKEVEAVGEIDGT